MIADHQPTIFNGQIIAALSSASDGNMSFLTGTQGNTLKNRKAFLKKVGISSDNTTFMQIRYNDAEHFTRYTIANESHKKAGLKNAESSLIGDAVVVTEQNHAVFLPLADCVGAIIYDSKNKILMVSHLGRHSTEQHGALKSILYMQDAFPSRTENIYVLLSPAVGKSAYPLNKFNGRGLQEVLVEQFLKAGIPQGNIEICSVDTAKSEDYFSHSQFLAGHRESNDRFAIVAMMPRESSLL